MSNPFVGAQYSVGGWSFGGSPGDPATSTGYFVHRNSLTNRAGSVSAIACFPGEIIAKTGYKINVNPLSSNTLENTEIGGVVKDVYVDPVYKDTSYYQWEDRKTIPQSASYCCISAKKDDNTDFTQSEIAGMYGTVFEYVQDETLSDGVIYDIDGNIAVTQNRRYVQIRILKLLYPNYDDDQLLDKAISIARLCGDSTIIQWDGTDIHFAGSIKHTCIGFGGIDFGGSRIYMPDYDSNFSEDWPPVIIKVLPNSYSDVQAVASDFTKYGTTKGELQNKVFTINSNYAGNSDMCLGDRIGFDTTIYCSPTMLTMPDGEFYGSHLYLVPESGNVPCYNVHDYPSVTFEISNGEIIARNSNKMSCLVQCNRSNVHLHNFVLYGSRQDVSTYHSRYLFSFERCADVEVDHIFGVNPIHLSSGYVLELSSITNAHIHDCHIGDSTKWGVMGCHHLTNGTFERCDLNRWDCHYAQYGNQLIKDCNLCFVSYGASGYGTFVIDGCTFTAKPSDAEAPLIFSRDDIVGVFDGNMVVQNCRFLQGTNDASKVTIWKDGTTGTKPSNSKITGSPERNRIIENCEFPNGCYAVFRTGLSAQADKPLYENLSYKIKDCAIDCVKGIVIPVASSQTVEAVCIEGCAVSDCYAVKDITCDLKVSNCELVTIKANSTIPKLIATGNVFSGSQSVSNFTAYALAGNIASDMASVNKHS